MAKLAEWADQLERRSRAAPEVIAVGPRPLGQRRLLQKGGWATAAVLIWAAQHWGLPGDHVLPPIPAVAVAPSLSLAVQRLSVPSMVPSRLAAVTALPEPPPTVALARQILAQATPQARFLALAITVEHYKPHPYWDSAGLNVGMGYCITRRLREAGEPQVRQDLTQAGLAAPDIAVLLGKDRRAQAQVTLSEEQAVALLRQVTPEYTARARAFVGAATFDALPEHRQAALTWLAYNTGPHLDQFHRLRQAVVDNRPEQALDHLTPTFNDGGTLVSNARAGAYLAAAYWSDQGLQAAVTQSDRFESLTAHTDNARQWGQTAAALAPTVPGRRPRTP